MEVDEKESFINTVLNDQQACTAETQKNEQKQSNEAKKKQVLKKEIVPKKQASQNLSQQDSIFVDHVSYLTQVAYEIIFTYFL